MDIKSDGFLGNRSKSKGETIQDWKYTTIEQRTTVNGSSMSSLASLSSLVQLNLILGASEITANLHCTYICIEKVA